MDFNEKIEEWFDADGVDRLEQTSKVRRIAPLAGVTKPDFGTFLTCRFNFECLLQKQFEYLGQTNVEPLAEDLGFRFVKADDFIAAIEIHRSGEEENAMVRAAQVASHFRRPAVAFLRQRDTLELGEWILTASGRGDITKKVSLNFFLEDQGRFVGDQAIFHPTQSKALCPGNFDSVKRETLNLIADILIPIQKFNSALLLRGEQRDWLQQAALDQTTAILNTCNSLRNITHQTFADTAELLSDLHSDFVCLQDTFFRWYD